MTNQYLGSFQFSSKRVCPMDFKACSSLLNGDIYPMVWSIARYRKCKLYSVAPEKYWELSKNITLYLNYFTEKKKAPYPNFLRLCMRFKTLKINKHKYPLLKKIRKLALVFWLSPSPSFSKSNLKRDEVLFVIYLWWVVTVTLRFVSTTLSFSISLAGHLLIGCEYVIKPCHIPY